MQTLHDGDRRKKMDLQGIEPWTTPMLREYYTTKPQARFWSCCSNLKRIVDSLIDGGLPNRRTYIARFARRRVTTAARTDLLLYVGRVEASLPCYGMSR